MKYLKSTIKLTSILIMLFFNSVVLGQADQFSAPSLDDEAEIPVTRVTLGQPEQGEEFAVQYFTGVTGTQEHRLAIEDFGYIVRPTMIQLYSETGDPLQIEFFKKNWNEVSKTGETKNGKYETTFKTAFRFGIIIKGTKANTPYVLGIAAGKEQYGDRNKLFVDAKTMKNNGGNKNETTSNVQASSQQDSIRNSESSNSKKGSNLLLIIISIALIGILALLFVLVLKKNKAVAVILIFCFSASSVMAANLSDYSPQNQYNNDQEGGNSNSNSDYSLGNEGINPSNNNYNRTNRSGYSNENSRTTSEEGEPPKNATVETIGKGAKFMEKNFTKFFKAGKSFYDLTQLDLSDQDYEPDMDPRGQPNLPTSCISALAGNREQAEKERACECLMKAYADLNFTRTKLERMMKIAKHRQRTLDDAISIGDGISGLHTMSSAAWQVERRKMVQLKRDFEPTYERGYNTVMDELYANLMEIDKCEAELGFENWYGLFGFMYFEFMKTRYATYK